MFTSLPTSIFCGLVVPSKGSIAVLPQQQQQHQQHKTVKTSQRPVDMNDNQRHQLPPHPPPSIEAFDSHAVNSMTSTPI